MMNLASARASVSPAAPATPPRRGTDAPLRTLHAALALSMIVAYFSAESERWRLLHNTAGYGMVALLVLRLIYAWRGPTPARGRVLLHRLRGSLANAVHNPFMALMLASVAALMVLMPVAVFTGWATEGDSVWMVSLAEWHGPLSEFTVPLTVAHLLAVAGVSYRLRRNHARLMWDGRLPGTGPSPVVSNRGVLGVGVVVLWGAALVGALVLAT